MPDTSTKRNKKRYIIWLPAALVGILIGLAGYTFYISRAYSYLSDDPRACVNCHIMAPEYSTWFHSSHGRVTTCNDCHVPHTSALAKYWFKANDGLRHASMFAMRLEPQVIHIRKPGEEVVQQNCLRCHGHLNAIVKRGLEGSPTIKHGQGRLCWECHRDVPHSRIRGLNSAPNARVPLKTEPIPQWLQTLSAAK